MSFFSSLPATTPDPFQTLIREFQMDECPDKVNLLIGVYRDEEGQPYPLPSVKEAFADLTAPLGEGGEGDSTHGAPSVSPFSFEYLLDPTGGEAFREGTRALVFGEEDAKASGAYGKRLASLQCVGGTGSLLIALLLAREALEARGGAPYAKDKDTDNDEKDGAVVALLPAQTWLNHAHVLREAGFTGRGGGGGGVREYRYLIQADGTPRPASPAGPAPPGPELDMEGLLEDLGSAPRGAVVLLHACAHNPTGVDPSPTQWEKIAGVVQQRGLFPLFDNAYQGLASGCVEQDAYPMRLFASLGLEMAVASSFSKNFGLYGLRTGALTVLCRDEQAAQRVQAALQHKARSIHLTPPSLGGAVVGLILSDSSRKAQWRGEVSGMVERIQRARQALREALEAMETPPGDWSHLCQQRGMFSYSGLTVWQVRALKTCHSVYMQEEGGRVNMCGITAANTHRVATAIDRVVRQEGGGGVN